MRNPASASSSSTAKTIATKTTPCCSKVGIKRGPWTPEEDEVLASYVKREGEGRWRTLPKRAGLQRCGKSCRLRWMNYLRPSVKRGHIAPDEEDLILRLHRLLGNRWSLIAGRIPGRTDNEIKNYWNTHLSKKLISQGIDPRTHKPLNPYPISSSAAQHKDTSSNIDASTSKNPKAPYPYPAPAVLEEISGGTDDPNKQKPDHQPQDGDGDCAGVGVGVIQVCNDQNWQNADELMMMMMGLHDKSTYVQRECLENCNNNNNEDVFSSFLDSLMEDDYANQYHHRPSNIAPPALPMTSSAAVPGFDNQVNAWESGLRPTGLVGESSSIGEQPNEVLHINHLP